MTRDNYSIVHWSSIQHSVYSLFMSTRKL